MKYSQMVRSHAMATGASHHALKTPPPTVLLNTPAGDLDVGCPKHSAVVSKYAHPCQRYIPLSLPGACVAKTAHWHACTLTALAKVAASDLQTGFRYACQGRILPGARTYTQIHGRKNRRAHTQTHTQASKRAHGNARARTGACSRPGCRRAEEDRSKVPPPAAHDTHTLIRTKLGARTCLRQASCVLCYTMRYVRSSRSSVSAARTAPRPSPRACSSSASSSQPSCASSPSARV